jgi:glycosyltransferase involved in cell wall biosynthesis
VRIVQLIPSLAVGGLERVATTLTLQLHERGNDVIVCSRGAELNLAFQDALQSAGVPIVRIPRPRPNPRALVASVRALAPLLREHRPDIVHAHNPAAAVVAAFARPRETAIVMTYHGVAPSQLRLAARPLALAADIVVGIGPAASEEIARAGFPRARLRTVNNAVDASVSRPRDEIRSELGLADDDEVVTMVGRYAEEKNHALLLDAFAQLDRPRLRGVLVGVGPLEAELRQRVRELGLDDRVLLTGARADAIDVVAASDVLALTSRREGLGLTLIEALSVGTPVVATAVGGIIDVVGDGEAGLLVPSGDVAALRDAIERLLDDAELRNRLVANGRRRVAEAFTVEDMVAGYLDAYSDAFEARRSRRRTGASPS